MFRKRLFSGVIAFALAAAAFPAFADVVSVNGTQLLFNGQPFQMHGVEIDAFEAPVDWYGPNEGNNPSLITALASYGATELQYGPAIRRQHH